MASSSQMPVSLIVNPNIITNNVTGNQEVIVFNLNPAILLDLRVRLATLEGNITRRSRTELTAVCVQLADLIWHSINQQPQLTSEELRNEIQRHVRKAVLLGDDICDHEASWGISHLSSTLNDNQPPLEKLEDDAQSLFSIAESYYSCPDGPIEDVVLATSLSDLVLGPLSHPDACAYFRSRTTVDVYPANRANDDLGIIPQDRARSQDRIRSQKYPVPSQQQISLKLLRKWALAVRSTLSLTTLSEQLYAAVETSNHIRVTLLIEIGADVNARVGEYGNALQTALVFGHLDIARLLLNHGADVNAKGGEYGHALRAASFLGHLDIARLLLEHGADVNAKGGELGDALQAASYRGQLNIVQLLLDHGADVNAKGANYGNAIYAASRWGHLDIARLLLEHGADVNAQGGEYGNALQVALYWGRLDLARLLLEHGADVNAQGGFYGNALQAASCGGKRNVVQLLLEHGADVDAQGGFYGNALQAASCGGQLDVAQLLLEHGADVDAQGGFYSNALNAASFWGRQRIITLLRQHGATEDAKLLTGIK